MIGIISLPGSWTTIGIAHLWHRNQLVRSGPRTASPIRSSSATVTWWLKTPFRLCSRFLKRSALRTKTMEKLSPFNVELVIPQVIPRPLHFGVTLRIQHGTREVLIPLQLKEPPMATSKFIVPAKRDCLPMVASALAYAQNTGVAG